MFKYNFEMVDVLLLRGHLIFFPRFNFVFSFKTVYFRIYNLMIFFKLFYVYFYQWLSFGGSRTLFSALLTLPLSHSSRVVRAAALQVLMMVVLQCCAVFYINIHAKMMFVLKCCAYICVRFACWCKFVQ